MLIEINVCILIFDFVDFQPALQQTSSSNSSAGDEGSDIEEGSKSTVTGSTPLSIPPPVTVASVPYEANAKGIFPGDEEINSDLDDSDDEADDDGQEADGGGTVDGMDIVFCVYDKVRGAFVFIRIAFPFIIVVRGWRRS